ncbi:hypothetical protein WJX72_011904 [[Myrmecia] bisecta]|uniref:SGNH hydrolase-type esterase domain-containing protein n=1 Tax=[Myrmecia] bisecta TaxID=41462 RepID=A0AAW1QSY2_9CHLO
MGADSIVDTCIRRQEKLAALSTPRGSWFNQRFSNITVVNSAERSTTSGYAARCLTSLVPAVADLVLIEYSYNDGYSGGETNEFGIHDPAAVKSCMLDNKSARRNYERLVRKLLTMWKQAPAIVGVQYEPWGLGPPFGFWHTGEDEINVVLKYYGVPSLSFRGAYYEAVMAGCKCFQNDIWSIEASL